MNTPSKAGEIVSILKREIENFTPSRSVSDVGEVVQCGDGIARVYGLHGIASGELIEIELPNHTKASGIALNLEEDNVGVVLLDNTSLVMEGQVVRGTGKIARVPVGEQILGRVIDPLGRPLDGGAAIESDQFLPIERKAPGIVERANVAEPLITGIKAIDALVPVGRGQRELIIGDRRTGKTAIAIDAIINQGRNESEPVYCFYVAIGQKISSVVRIVEKLRQHNALSYTTVICATASDPASLQYIAPYAACSMAEYFRDSGKHALIVFDDLTKHAQAYRQISLLLRRPPGREAFPGDIFYLHSRLLERAAKLSPERGNGSLTALPIVETQAGDISAYIPTNVISITDGQIFLESHLFNSGLRPAINAGISVSRVGGAAQNKAMKKTAGSLRLDLAQFRELASFSQFSSDLDKTTLSQLSRGERLTEILKQKQYEPLDITRQVVLLYAGTHGYLDKYSVSKLAAYERHLFIFLEIKHNNFMENLAKSGELTKEQELELNKILTDFSGFFNPDLSLDSMDSGISTGFAYTINQPSSGTDRRELLKFIERATAREFASSHSQLENEIDLMMDGKSDKKEMDHFDHILHSCKIFDISEKMDRDQLFRKFSKPLSNEVSYNKDYIFDKLVEREQSSSTALMPEFAVPHLVVPGEKKFSMIIVRSTQGVYFSKDAPSVHAIFFLAGSIDERSTHLLALAAIGQMVSETDFFGRWMNATNERDLRALLHSIRQDVKN